MDGPCPSERESALLTGKAGILLVGVSADARAGSSPMTLHARVRANIDERGRRDHVGCSPETLVAARHMLDWTQDARWREAWDESAMRSRPSRFRRPVDAAALRACDALSRPRARSRRKRPGARAAARLEASVEPLCAARPRHPRTRRVRRGRARELAARRARALGEHDAERSVSSGATGRRGSSARRPPISKSRSSSPARSSRGRRASSR